MSTAREQVARLLALVPYIQSRDEVALDQAAADFAVSPAQLVKDLHVLWFCGLPGLGMGDLIEVDFDALEGDGVLRVSNVDYLRRPLRLDSTEAASLVVALRAVRDGSPDPVQEVVDRALAKLEAAAGEGADAASSVGVRLQPADAELARTRALLEEAVAHGRQVRLEYYVPSRDEDTARTVDPLRVVSTQGHTYLDAWCHLAEGQRLFRVDRIGDVRILDSPAEDHPGVTPRDLSQGLFQPSPTDTAVTLHLNRAARWVADYYPVEEQWPADDGGLLVRLRVGDPAWLPRLVMRLGGAARVVEPQQVADTVRRTAAAALRLYR